MTLNSMESDTKQLEPVKRRREVNAANTRRAIVEAATELFLAHGYHTTTVESVAERAGVAVQTIYNSVGSKRDLLSGALDLAAAGDAAPVPASLLILERARQEQDPARVVELLVEFWRGGWVRTAPIFGVMRQAAALDPEIAALERQRAKQRLRNYELGARMLEERGSLRPGLTVAQTAATIFVLGHPDMYRMFVLDEGWDPERYAAWVEATLKTALLP
jgi:AcrR family transcriptional regulator